MDHPEPTSVAQSPDYSLLLARLESQILKGENRQAVVETLQREEIWIKLGTDIQMKWSHLAQMNGQPETALAILAHVCQADPGVVDAWSRRLELLWILDRREEIAGVLAACREVLGPERVQQWLSRMGGPGGGESAGELGSAAAPFEAMHRKRESIERYLDLFSGREDCFARQWVEKAEGKQGYVPVRRAMEPADAEEHLSGRKTYGIYLMRADATVATAVIDMDLAQEFRKRALKADEKQLIRKEHGYLVGRVMEASRAAGMAPLIEFSGGKGFHFWFFFSPPVGAADARKALDPIVTGLKKDVRSFTLELFPKQESLSGKGLGNLVKLPLGVHRLTGKKSYFPACADRSTEAQLAHLAGVRPSDLRQALPSIRAAARENVVIAPRFRQWGEKLPELARVEACCPPMGQIIAACRSRKALSMREEKVIYQTLGFLPQAKKLAHALLSGSSEYNPHLVDYRLSLVRGKPLGCKRIHSLLGFTGEMCPFPQTADYLHPLLHLGEWVPQETDRSEKVESLSASLESLKLAIAQVERFLK